MSTERMTALSHKSTIGDLPKKMTNVSRGIFSWLYETRHPFVGRATQQERLQQRFDNLARLGRQIESRNDGIVPLPQAWALGVRACWLVNHLANSGYPLYNSHRLIDAHDHLDRHYLSRPFSHILRHLLRRQVSSISCKSSALQHVDYALNHPAPNSSLLHKAIIQSFRQQDEKFDRVGPPPIPDDLLAKIAKEELALPYSQQHQNPKQAATTNN